MSSRQGVWLVEGGMSALAAALAELAERARRDASATARRSSGSSAEAGRVSGVVLLATASGSRPTPSSSTPTRRRSRPGCSARRPRRAATGRRRAERSLSAVTWCRGREARGLSARAPQRLLLGRLPGRVRRDPAPGAGCPTTRPSTSARRTATDAGACARPGRNACCCLVNAPADGERPPRRPRRSRRCETQTCAAAGGAAA